MLVSTPPTKNQTSSTLIPQLTAGRGIAIRAIRQQVERGAAWSIVATLCAQGVTLITNMIAARALGPQVFGGYCVVQNTAVTVGNFGCAGLGISATRFVAGWRLRNVDKLAGTLQLLTRTSTLAGALFAILLFVLAPCLSSAVFGSKSLTLMLRLVAASVAFLSIAGFQQGVLLGFQALRPLAVAGVVHLIISLTIALTLVRYGGLTGAVAAFVAYSISLWCLQRFAIVRECRIHRVPKEAPAASDWSDVLASCAVPSALSGLASQAAFWGATAILARSRGGFTQMALFSAAFTLRQAVAFLPSIVARVAGPVLYDFGLSPQQFKRSLGQTVAVSAAAAVALAIPLSLATPWILSLFGPAFSAGAKAARLLVISAALESVAMTLYHAVVRKGYFWTYLGIIACWGTCVIAGAYCGSHGSGATDLAAGYVVAWLFVCLALSIIAMGKYPTEDIQ